MRRHEGLAGVALPDDPKVVTMLIDVCFRELRDYMELKNKHLDYKIARGDSMKFVESKRETATSQVKAMELGEVHNAYQGEEVLRGRHGPGEGRSHQVLVHAVTPYKGYAKGTGPAKGQANRWQKGWSTNAGKSWNHSESKGWPYNDGKGRYVTA